MSTHTVDKLSNERPTASPELCPI